MAEGEPLRAWRFVSPRDASVVLEVRETSEPDRVDVVLVKKTTNDVESVQGRIALSAAQWRELCSLEYDLIPELAPDRPGDGTGTGDAPAF